MRHSHARFSGVDTSCRMLWSAGYITNMFESEFSAHTGANEEGFSDGRYNCFFDLDTWRNYVRAAGFVEVGQLRAHRATAPRRAGSSGPKRQRTSNPAAPARATVRAARDTRYSFPRTTQTNYLLSPISALILWISASSSALSLASVS